jgi:hypothetical protein
MISSVFYLKIINNDDKCGFTDGKLHTGERRSSGTGTRKGISRL